MNSAEQLKELALNNKNNERYNLDLIKVYQRVFVELEHRAKLGHLFMEIDFYNLPLDGTSNSKLGDFETGIIVPFIKSLKQLLEEEGFKFADDNIIYWGEYITNRGIDGKVTSRYNKVEREK